MPLTGHTANITSDAVLDTGIIMIGNEKLGVTKGPPQFGPNREIINMDFDGKTVPLKLLDRIFQGEPLISGTLIEFGPTATGEQIERAELGIAGVDSGVTPNTIRTYTPKSSGTFILTGEYLTDLRLIFERAIAVGAGVKKYLSIHFPIALVKSYGPIQGGAVKDNATIPFEFAGRGDPAGSIDLPAYRIELRESLPT